MDGGMKRGKRSYDFNPNFSVFVCVFTAGLTDWEDDEILASVLAVSQQEYLDSIKKNSMHREPSPDSS